MAGTVSPSSRVAPRPARTPAGAPERSRGAALAPRRERRPERHAPARSRRHGRGRRGRPRASRQLRAIRLAGVLDRLLRGRAWVALIGVLLTGIVFLNVALLELNGGIARMDAKAAELKRENAALRMRVARLGSSERIQQAAAGRGFVPSEPGKVGYLVPRWGDVARAARALEDWRLPPPATGVSPSPGGAGLGAATASPPAGGASTGEVGGARASAGASPGVPGVAATPSGAQAAQGAGQGLP